MSHLMPISLRDCCAQTDACGCCTSHYHPGEMTFEALAQRRGWTGSVDTLAKARGRSGEGNELYLSRR